MKYKQAQEVAQGLRELADWVEEYGPRLPVRQLEVPGYNFLHDDYNGKHTAKQKARIVAKLLARGGTCEKKFQDNYLILKRAFGPLELEFNLGRNAVCRRVVVGTEHVEEHVIEAHDREIVEWVCEDPILTA